ncbi:MAG: hypothetical protein LBB52_04025 [Desulfovibrio sp.]|nr:hypothetical protein [Desulfovibrio sp.]
MYAEKRSRASFDAAALALPKEAVLTFEEEEKCIGELQDKDTLLGVFGAEKFVFMEENEPPLPPLRVELVAVVNQKI